MPKRKKWLWIGLPVAGVAVAAVLLGAFSRPQAATSLGQTGVVTRGSLTVSATEAGEVEANKRRIIANELQWPATITYLVPEGTIVREGETIIQFECKELEDALAQEEINVTNANSIYIQAHEKLELKRKQAEQDTTRAAQAILDAEEDRVRYREGDWPVKKNEAESAIQIAQQDLTLAQEKLSFKIKANQDPELNTPYSANEIEADKLNVERLKLALEKATNERAILVKFTDPRDQRRGGIAVDDAKFNLEKIQIQAKTDLQSGEADERSAKIQLDLRTKRLKDYREQQAKQIVRAEKEGLVVYDIGNRQRMDVTVEVGAKINPRQQLMIIPDMTTLQVRTRVYEAVIDQLHARKRPVADDPSSQPASQPATQSSTQPSSQPTMDFASQATGQAAGEVATEPTSSSAPATASRSSERRGRRKKDAAYVEKTEGPETEAFIKLDAKPDQSFSGYVSKVAPLPDSQNRWLNPGVNVFVVTVQFNERVEGLKPGMTAQVELVLARLQNVLSVPIAAVFTEQEHTYTWKVVDGKPVQCPVKVGRMNDKRVEIRDGLKEGESVLLAPPPGVQAKPAQQSPGPSSRPAIPDSRPASD